MPDGDPIIIGQGNSASNPGNETSLSRNQVAAGTVFVARNLNAGDGIHGEASPTNLVGVGVQGSGATGVQGRGSLGVEGIGGGYGVRGSGSGPAGVGVEGSGDSAGVKGTSTSLVGIGVRGHSNVAIGVQGTTPGVLPAVSGVNSGQGHGVQGISHRGGSGVSGVSQGVGVGAGVSGFCSDRVGVRGESAIGSGVQGSSGFIGVRGTGDSFAGVLGFSSSGFGVRGDSTSGWGVLGRTEGTIPAVAGYNIGSGNGVSGFSSGSGHGVYGRSPAGEGGFFDGGITVVNGAKNFKIDHPLDPDNRYLLHTCVESSEMKNVYDGVARLDEDGAGWVELPEWFEALNGDFRYQLTAVGRSAPGLHVAEELSENRFKIAGGVEEMRVCWQVTGSRNDRWAAANPFEVEQEKHEEERGRYLEPNLYDAPEEQRVMTEPAAEALRAASTSAAGEDAVEVRRRMEAEQRSLRASGIDFARLEEMTRHQHPQLPPPQVPPPPHPSMIPPTFSIDAVRLEEEHRRQLDELRRLVEEQRREIEELRGRMKQQGEAPPEAT
jgi:hypothetical protein